MAAPYGSGVCNLTYNNTSNDRQTVPQLLRWIAIAFYRFSTWAPRVVTSRLFLPLSFVSPLVSFWLNFFTEKAISQRLLKTNSSLSQLATRRVFKDFQFDFLVKSSRRWFVPVKPSDFNLFQISNIFSVFPRDIFPLLSGRANFPFRMEIIWIWILADSFIYSLNSNDKFALTNPFFFFFISTKLKTVIKIIYIPKC